MHCGRSNNNPHVIVQHYIDAVRAIEGIYSIVIVTTYNE